MALEKVAAQDVGHRLLRCFVCGRTEEKTPTELLNYCQSTWPRCCGEVMAYCTQAHPVFRPSADTVPDLLLGSED